MAEPIDQLFIETVAAMASPTHRRSPAPAEPVREGSVLTVARCLELFDAQLGSRHLDLAARVLRADGAGFYTIGSSGHEGNAAVAGALRPTDPALLHYRSCGFFLERARQVGGGDPLRDVLLGVVAAAADPISGGRHKVFGRHDLAVIPQTSTIASHLPRAVGVAFAIGRARRLGVDSPWPADAVAVCSFGDASANHSTAVGAINAAALGAYQGLPVPLLLVCEDNGIGVSVPTPGAGSSPPTRAGWGSSTSPRTAATSPPPSTRQRAPRTGCASTGGRRSCTCARSG
ncbi:dehydrogenase E1 component family protein [Rhodococcus sp. MTM3W5.2]|nr:dehydrogenase E1 component family protein [Rhodococcus sp. MTM3W5.2]